MVDGEAVAKQKGDVFFTQKTSRQHAVTPILGGRLEKEGNLVRPEAVKGCFEDGEGDCDCSRTRTTSRGVTAKQMVSFDSSPCARWSGGAAIYIGYDSLEKDLPRREVRRLPETAESIF